MRDFVRENRSQLMLVSRELNQPAVDVDSAARKCHRIALPRIDDPEAVSQRRQRTAASQTQAHFPKVIGSGRVANKRQSFIGLPSGFRSDFNILLEGEEVVAWLFL